MKKPKITVVALMVVAASWVLFGGNNPTVTRGSFTDSRDDRTYSTIRIDSGQEWFAENLNYVDAGWSHNDYVGWGDGTFGSWCYGDVSANCEKYGRLYTWDAAMEACPAGWRLPTCRDWYDLDVVVAGWRLPIRWNDLDLVQASGGNTAGTKLKVSAPDWDGIDIFEFSALPGGYRWIVDGLFYYLGYQGYWWSATEYEGSFAYTQGMRTGDASMRGRTHLKSFGFSVRCVQN